MVTHLLDTSLAPAREEKARLNYLYDDGKRQTLMKNYYQVQQTTNTRRRITHLPTIPETQKPINIQPAMTQYFPASLPPD